MDSADFDQADMTRICPGIYDETFTTLVNMCENGENLVETMNDIIDLSFHEFKGTTEVVDAFQQDVTDCIMPYVMFIASMYNSADILCEAIELNLVNEYKVDFRQLYIIAINNMSQDVKVALLNSYTDEIEALIIGET